MKKALYPGITLVAVLVVLFFWKIAVTAESNPPDSASIPTSSLDRYYPPKSGDPLFYLSMHQMAAPFSGMISDLLEGDNENAAVNFGKFKAQYLRVSRMIPEWEKLFAQEPVEHLEAALQAGQPDKIMEAAEKMGQVCHGCHVQNMAAVQQRYHWPSFDGIMTTDPVSGRDVTFAQLMQMVETDMTGIGNDLEQKQNENARMHSEGLASRFAALKETCDACHDSERAYYVDDKIMSMLGEIRNHLKQQDVDPQAVGMLLQKIGIESCNRCHLVHVPAAYTKHAD